MTPGKDFKAELLSLQTAYNASLKLAEKISGSGLSFDAAIAIARGGFPPARFLCDFLNIDNLYSIQIRHYSKGAKKHEEATVLNKSSGDIEGKSILLIDDVNDSGSSLTTAIRNLHEAGTLKTAVLHQKNTTQLKADFVAEYIKEWKWLIYPWAAAEDVLEFLKKGDKLEASLHEARDYLIEKYDLHIDELSLQNILDLKSNYYLS